MDETANDESNESERDRGVLTPRERRYLRGELDIDAGTAYARSIRQNIRNHLLSAVLDFPLILDAVEDRDREKVFEEIGVTTPAPHSVFGQDAPVLAPETVRAGIAFFLMAFRNDEELELNIAEALKLLADTEEVHREIEISIDVTEPETDVGELKRAAHCGELTYDEIERRFRERQIDMDTMIQLIDILQDPEDVG